MEETFDRDYRYCILYTQSTEQHRLKNVIERHLPEADGEVFCPCVEYWRRDKKEAVVTALFPGYVFLYTRLNRKEIHAILQEGRPQLQSGVRELGLRESQGLERQTIEDDAIYEYSDVSEEEAEFLDFLRQGNGLLTMSAGYEEKGKYHVMEGPLKPFEDRISRVDKHNRKAFLNILVRGHAARVGFECKPKAHWFPKNESRLVQLEGGGEFDLTEIAKKMMMGA